MIKKMIITGDTHGNIKRRLATIKYSGIIDNYNPNEIGIIILGDVGLNYWLNATDIKNKKEASEYGYYIYCVRGNHEERPEELESIEVILDQNIKGLVWYEPQFPLIRYLMDGGTYEIEGMKTLVIGGGYSVDKFYRLETGNKWFPKEQLSEEEQNNITKKLQETKYDLILAHTCPYSWRPTDLFLTCVNQSTVDSSMELWLENIKENFDNAIYLFGHYHADRLVRPKVEMYYHDFNFLNDIKERWESNKQPDYYYEKDPKYYIGR